MGLFDFLKKEELNLIKRLEQQLEKYKPIINIEEESEKIAKQNAIKLKELNHLNSELEDLNNSYSSLKKELEIYSNDLENIEVGLYEPIFNFDTSEEYKNKKTSIIQQQKCMLKDGDATVSNTNWTISGSEAKGRAFTKKNSKLLLRAFNGDCDSLISKVRWNNVDRIKERIKKSFDTINKLGKEAGVEISKPYLDLKLEELAITFEYEEKRKIEKDEERERKALIREEQKAKKEFERAQKEAEKKEKQYFDELEKAKKKFSLVTGEEHEKLKSLIEELEKQLKEATENKERALSMAQQTKRGHVYVISNIGSFGENVYKIGMTRRLEPLDRVRELGDASVPFYFDVHAMIYSEDAPALEAKLHKEFESKRVNLLNTRREFFNVTLSEIQQIVKDSGIDAEFVKLAEAEEYRETLTLKK